MNTLRFPKWLTLSTVLLFIFILTSYTSNAQTGSVKGTLIDSSSSELIFGAIISSPENPTIGTQSDMDGVFLISNIKPGTYNFKVSYIGYKEYLYKDVVVVAGQTTNLGTVYLEIDADVPVIEIVGQMSTNTEEAVVEEIKQSDNVVSGISAQQIQKGQDRDAAQVVQRIPGVSVIDNRFIMIRGLNDRYNSVWLNNATAPSSETDRKAFSFDMVSSNLIDRILVYKTASADLPGDFAGGFVKIYTITPKDKSFTFNIGTAYRTGTTGHDFVKDKSPTDFLGFDNGQRALPAKLPLYTSVNGLDQSTINNYGQSFNNNWVSSVSKALPDLRFSTTYVNSLSVKNGSRLGMLASLNYTNTNTNFNIKRIDADGSGFKTQLRDDHQYTNEVRVGAMLNFSYIINANHKIEFRNFLNQNGRTQTTNRDVLDGTNQLIRKQVAMAYRSRTIYTSQLAGDHTFNKGKTKMDWTMGYGHSTKNEPDLRRATYYQDPSNPGQFLITPANNANDLTNGGRLYQKLTENSGMLALNATHKVSEKFELEAGFYGEYKARAFVAKAFAYTLQGASRAGSYLFDSKIGTSGVTNANYLDGTKGNIKNNLVAGISKNYTANATPGQPGTDNKIWDAVSVVNGAGDLTIVNATTIADSTKLTWPNYATGPRTFVYNTVNANRYQYNFAGILNNAFSETNPSVYNFTPAANSPALTGADYTGLSSYFDQVSYIGAFAAGSDWTAGWANFVNTNNQ